MTAQHGNPEVRMHGGRTAVRLGDYNQQVTLEMIRLNGGASRTEIAERTGLTGTAVSKIVRRLLEAGLVSETDRIPETPRGGRRHIGLRLNPGAAFAFGVHIDRDQTRYVLLDLAGGTVAAERHGTPREDGPEAMVRQISEVTARIRVLAGVPSDRVVGLGLGVPGPVDPRRGVVSGPFGLRGWDEVPLRDLLAERIRTDVVIDEDSVTAMMGEEWIGKARGVRDLLFVYIAWGLGAGLILDGHVYRGASGLAGGLAHFPVDPAGPPCQCGSNGCLIHYTSPGRIEALLAERLGEPAAPRYPEICRTALARPGPARDLMTEAARRLGLAVVAQVSMLDPELVVLGGPALDLARPFYEQEVGRALRERTMLPVRRSVRMEISEAGGNGGAVGAASMVFHSAFGPRIPSA